MQRLIRKLEAGGTARVAVVGGSMTAGRRCSDTVLGDGVDCAWSRRFRDWLPRQFPRWSFQLDNLAQSAWSLETWLASGRVHVEVADYDVVLLDTGINSASLQHAVQGHLMDEMLWTLLGPERKAGRRPVVLVTEAFRTCGAIRRDCDKDCERGQQGSVPYFGSNGSYAWCDKWWHTQDNEMDVVRHYGVPVASYRDAVWPRLNQPPRLLPCFWNGLIHPASDVHALFAAVVAHAFHGAVLQGCAAIVSDATSARPRPKETEKPGGDEEERGSEGSDEKEDEVELKRDALGDKGEGGKDGEEAEDEGEEDEAEDEDEEEKEGKKVTQRVRERMAAAAARQQHVQEEEEEEEDEASADGDGTERKPQQGKQGQNRGGPESSSSGGSGGGSRKDSESSDGGDGGGGGWTCTEEPARKMHSSANLTRFCSSIAASAAASSAAAAAAESDGKGSVRDTAKTADGTTSTQGAQQQHGNGSLTHHTRTFTRLAPHSPGATVTWRAERVRGGWRFGEDVPGNGKPGWFVDIGNVSGSHSASHVDLSAPSGGGEAHTVTFSVVFSPNPQLEVTFLHTYERIGGVRAYLHAPDAAADVGTVAAGPQRQAPGEAEAQDGGQEAEAASERASAQEARREQQQRRQQGQVGGSGGGGGSLTRGSEPSVADAAAAPLAALREHALSIFTISGLNSRQFSVPHTAVFNERLEAKRVGRGPSGGVTVLRAGLAAVAAAGGGRYSLTFELLPVPYGKFKLLQITTC